MLKMNFTVCFQCKEKKNDKEIRITDDNVKLCVECWDDLEANDPDFQKREQIISWKDACLIWWQQESIEKGRELNDEEKADCASKLMDATISGEIPSYLSSDN